MSTLEVAQPTGASSAPALVATRRLALLDELRVPYEDAAALAPDRRWASLYAADPSRALHWFVGSAGELATGWALHSLQLWGYVASDTVATSFARSLPGQWFRDTPIRDRAGVTRSWVWRSTEGATILPFDPDEQVANLRSERYLDLVESRMPSPTGLARRIYYAVRPALPRAAQLAVRRAFTRVQARATFPRWPVEPALHDLVSLVLQRVADAVGQPVPYIASWPRGKSWALVLTHDVETAAGRDAIDMVRAVEEAAGYRSSWNLVPERYRVPDALVERLQAAGCEVGVHGLRHDGRDLESLRTLESRLPEMRRWARRWRAVGFRSPATHRVWEWMPRLGFVYDSSYPDTDPYEPMAGGCCCWIPFFNREMVELPITLAQDHTMFVILRRDESLWRQKAEFLRARGGMALALVHPDYMRQDGRLAAYSRLLGEFRDDATAWKALPCEVAEWWRRRAATAVRLIDGRWQPVGPAETEAAIAFALPDSTLRPSR
jgi:peptidoglycan/xylan/chitin deacetylase (PgdA/CDA1 family)